MKALLFTVAAVAVFWPGIAGAYTVGSDFADPCHEQLTLSAFFEYGVDLPTETIPLPTSDEWLVISEQLVRNFNLEVFDEQQQLVILSLLIGVRSPDTDGHSLLDLDSVRLLHASPDGQFAHALRAIDNDGPEGDRVAVEGIREHILAQVQLAVDAGARPPAQQIIKANFFLDFYGLFEVEVWAPVFHLAQALHALQDSFSHTIRSDDFQRVRHVMNYAEAIGSGFEESRDGIAHSMSMDNCRGETAPVVNAAREATIEFTIAVSGKRDREEIKAAVLEVLDKWLTYEPGCDFTNDYCGSHWVSIARIEQTRPYLEEFLGCELVGLGAPASRSPWALLAALGLLGMIGRGGRR